MSLAFVHPILGTLAILFAIWIMSRGLVARQGRKQSAKARRTHRKWAFYALGAWVVALLTGVASTLWLRPDLELGETWHLGLGLGLVALMGVAGLLTRYFTRTPALRRIHPWVGIAAVVGGIVQALIGIELLP